MIIPLSLAVLLGCRGDIAPARSTPIADDTGSQPGAAPIDSAADTGDTALDVYHFALGCYTVSSDEGPLGWGGEGFVFGAEEADVARFFMKPADLGTYLLYDQGGGYLVGEEAEEGAPLLRQTRLDSDVLRIEDGYISGAEWTLQPAALDPGRYQVLNRRTGLWLGGDGLRAAEGAIPVSLEPAEGCMEHPELGLYAEGTPAVTHFDDGDLFGIVDTHSHLLAEWGFGGGGLFHGAPFHRLGVEHALPDCSIAHGEQGRRDIFGYVFDGQGAGASDLEALLPALLAGELSEDNHATAGYPQFTEWPDAVHRSTHQVQYYRWLERAWLGGLRLVVQHAVSNSAICDMTIGLGIQESRYSCEDMVGVDRSIEEAYAMERYIDAQHGGPGLGWFRVVQSPEQAREVIGQGKLAVILGIETSDLFGCRLTPREGSPVCDEAYVSEQLDRYYALGVRALFPVHKYDNAFSAGDGDRAFIELGNFVNSGYWLNFVEDCPADVPAIFDQGSVYFGGLNRPREDYLSEPPNDMSGFPEDPLLTLLPFLSELQEGSLEGAYCQNAGLTELGEYLITEMMARGMIIEVDHLPQRSYQRAYELLEQYDYPAVGSHGGSWDGRLYALGGVSKSSLGTCRDPDRPGATLEGFLGRIDQIAAAGGYPAEGFGFDLNGFAGARGPRFAEGACASEQVDPVRYPFTSYAGDITFSEPRAGERRFDFNTEGLAHIGLLPELLDDARRDAVSEGDLEPLFRSAEGYIRMWERAEERAVQLSE